MNLQEFINFQTSRMKAFEQHWKKSVEPAMIENDLLWWEYSADVIDWLEALEESEL